MKHIAIDDPIPEWDNSGEISAREYLENARATSQSAYLVAIKRVAKRKLDTNRANTVHMDEITGEEIDAQDA